MSYYYGDESNAKQWFRAICIMLIVLLCVTGLILLLGRGCMVSERSAVRATEKHGYSSIQVKERHNFFASWRGCGDSDVVAFKARAKNPKGDEVDIVICAGWPFKGVTVRTK